MRVSKKLWNRIFGELIHLRQIHNKPHVKDVIHLSENLLVSERQEDINAELDDLVREKIARNIGKALRPYIKYSVTPCEHGMKYVGVFKAIQPNADVES